MLRTTDPPRAAAFYGSLLGWTAVPATSDHTFLQVEGKTVASMQRISSGTAAWVPHVAVDDLEQTIAAAIALGGTLAEQADIPGIARTALLRDGEQALFGLWQPAPHPGAERRENVGAIWWIELMSRDVGAGAHFYSRLFGWTVRETSFEPIGTYRVFERPGNQEGGLNQILPEWGMHPQWGTIVSVDDCDALYARACDLGGESAFIHTVPKHGRIGGIFDPHQAWIVMRGPVPAATT